MMVIDFERARKARGIRFKLGRPTPPKVVGVL